MSRHCWFDSMQWSQLVRAIVWNCSGKNRVRSFFVHSDYQVLYCLFPVRTEYCNLSFCISSSSSLIVDPVPFLDISSNLFFLSLHSDWASNSVCEHSAISDAWQPVVAHHTEIQRKRGSRGSSPLMSARQTKSKIEEMKPRDFSPLYNISKACRDRLMLSASNVC